MMRLEQKVPRWLLGGLALGLTQAGHASPSATPSANSSTATTSTRAVAAVATDPNAGVPPRAPRQAEPACPETSYDVPPSCPSAEEFAQRVAPEIDPNDLPFSVRIHEVAGGYELQLGGFEERWTNTSCTFLVDVAAFSVGAAKFEGNARRLSRAECSTANEPLETVSPRETPVTPPAVHAPASRHPMDTQERDWSLVVSGLGAATVDELSWPNAFVGALVGARWRRLRVAVSGYWSPAAQHQVNVSASRSVPMTLQSSGAELETCWLSGSLAEVVTGAQTYVGGCLLGALRRSASSVPGVVAPAPERTWVDAGAGAALGLGFDSGLQLELAPALLIAPRPASIDAGALGSAHSQLEGRLQLRVGWQVTPSPHQSRLQGPPPEAHTTALSLVGESRL